MIRNPMLERNCTRYHLDLPGCSSDNRDNPERPGDGQASRKELKIGRSVVLTETIWCSSIS